MFELKPRLRRTAFAYSGLVSSLLLAFSAQAQQAQKQSPKQTTEQQQKLEQVTVTGSNLRRVDSETVAPVQIITREELERSGKPTVAEVIRAIPANSGGSFDESFANSFAPGSAGVSLRGLGQKTTLVLINGRRVAGYGFAQNIQDSFVDLNSIPTSAVERVEILKDGASAIYGSDAIAGVVNVIFRRDFQGAEAAATVGRFSGNNDYRANVGWGWGDLASQKINVFGVLDFYKRDQVQLSETRFGQDRDFRDTPGGRNFQSLTGAGTWAGLPGSANANLRRAISDCTALGGTVIGYQEAVLSGLLGAATSDPSSANSLSNLLATPIGSGFNQAGNSWCKFDYNKQYTAVPGTQRVGFTSRATLDISPTTQAYAELGLSHNETQQSFQSSFLTGTVGLDPVNGSLWPYIYNANFPAGVGGNPLGVPARLAGTLVALGTRDVEINSNAQRYLLGAKYELASGALTWDLDSGLSYSETEVKQKNYNLLSKSATNALLGISPDRSTPVGTVSGSACNWDAPLSTIDACRSILVNWTRTGKSQLTSLDTKARTELGQLPGGAIGFAVGADYRNEKVNDTPEDIVLRGDVLGQGTTRVEGSRHNFAVFSELALPLTKQLDVQAALRSDSYSDFGNALTPKLGIKFKPAQEFLLRANWGRGFRAPSLPEISPSEATLFIGAFDPLNGTTSTVAGSYRGNSDLKAEKSRSSTVGFVWEPTEAFNFSLDWYEISWNNIVGLDTFQAILDNDVNALDRQNDATCSGGDARVVRDPSNNCAVSTISSGYRNLTRTRTNGVDLDLRYSLRSALGRFTWRLNTNYINTFKEDGASVVGRNDGTNTIPRIKGILGLDWERGAWTAAARANYIHHYYNALYPLVYGPTVNNESTANRAFQNGAAPRYIPSNTTYDAYLKYRITPKFSVNAAVLNIFNTNPPFDPGYSTINDYDVSQYNVLGRIYRVGVGYRF